MGRVQLSVMMSLKLNLRSKLPVLVLAALAYLTIGINPAQAQQSSNEGWTTTIYPIYGWLPVFGADIRLPEIPNPPPCDGCGSGGPIRPGGNVDSNFNRAAFAAVVVENKWLQAEANVLYAGMSAEAARPNLKVDVGTFFAGARLGARVLPNMFVYTGFRHMSLNVKATALVFDEVQWKPGIWEGLVGLSYTPRLSPHWRLLTKADYGGFGADDHETMTATASIEWHPASHLAVNMGYGLFKLEVDGTVRNRAIHLDQTLHGPILGIGITF
jgi:hypothetical protein